MGWCKLRRLEIHPEISGEFWCHHWTALPPRLPLGGQDGLDSQQLALTPLLVEG